MVVGVGEGGSLKDVDVVVEGVEELVGECKERRCRNLRHKISGRRGVPVCQKPQGTQAFFRLSTRHTGFFLSSDVFLPFTDLQK